MTTFPLPQEKPARRLTYAEKRRAGLVPPKKRARLARVSKGKLGVQARYVRWIKAEMEKATHCGKCHRHRSLCGPLEPHHPYGRFKEHLFKVVPLGHHCHAWVHEYPNDAFTLGWIQPELKGRPVNPDHPKPWRALLPMPGGVNF